MNTSEVNGERRRAPRVAASGDALLVGRESKQARLLDVSMRGCLLRCEQPVALGQILDVVLDLDSGEVRAKARVAEVSQDGPGKHAAYLAGMEFMALAPEDEQRLERFVQAARRRKSASPA